MNTNVKDVMDTVREIRERASEWNQNLLTSTANLGACQRAMAECQNRYDLALADHSAAVDNLKFLLSVKETLIALFEDISNPSNSTMEAWKNPAAAMERRRLNVSLDPLDPSEVPITLWRRYGSENQGIPENQRTKALRHAKDVFNSLKKMADGLSSTTKSPEGQKVSTERGGEGQNPAQAQLQLEAESRRAAAIASLRTALQRSMRTVIATALVSQRIDYYKSCLDTAMDRTDTMLNSLKKRTDLLARVVRERKVQLAGAKSDLDQATLRVQSAQLISSVTGNSSSLVRRVYTSPGA